MNLFLKLLKEQAILSVNAFGLHQIMDCHFLFHGNVPLQKIAVLKIQILRQTTGELG